MERELALPDSKTHLKAHKKFILKEDIDKWTEACPKCIAKYMYTLSQW